jgi:cytochrome c oxidase subunit III
VLLFSSLTAAWAVRCAQLKQQKGLVINIVITIACACTFMVVKYFEYTHKFHDGLVWGGRGEKPAFGMKFNPKQEVWELPRFQKKHPEAAKLAEKLRKEGPAAAVAGAPPAQQASSAAPPTPTVAAVPQPASQAAAPALPAGAAGAPTTGASEKRSLPSEAWPLYQAGIVNERGELLRYPNRGHVFFGVYFFMTGLHGFHVVAGIVVWIWLLRKAMRGVFGPMYFGPIDYAALYWHLVDLIWIYLFPLLYLIA